MLNRQMFYPTIFRKIYGKYSGEINMQKRIESALPEHTFQLMKEASAMSGQTVKNFIAAAVTEKTLSVLERFKNVSFKEMPVPLEVQEKILKAIMTPELFEEANKRLHAEKNPIDISGCLRSFDETSSIK